MADSDDPYNIGYGKPPKRTRFTKGRSGNPKGRPKGSQNFSTIFDKASRERITVTTNGRTRSINKAEAATLQLMNKAASGDLKAINELRCWAQWMADSHRAPTPSFVLSESDDLVMASIVERIRQSDDLQANNETNPAALEPSGKED